eukprot:TRINITY_DN17435_c0_g1_i1.p1 TRINITY_DN17435_c0_g1~~TRINITY_DN17435_c0_g1_i1.p1  ORF type:complete len:198 (+),score=46.83 TRINITY_DN17435_c0_g1_i1:174-767(+)
MRSLRSKLPGDGCGSAVDDGIDGVCRFSENSGSRSTRSRKLRLNAAFRRCLALLVMTLPMLSNAISEVGFMVLDRPETSDCEIVSVEGDSLYVEYKVLIADQLQGPSSKLEFKLGAAPVAGWDQHLGGMCIEEERELTIPPWIHKNKNIGTKDDILKDETLQFQIRLLDINGQERKKSHAKQQKRKGGSKGREKSEL